MFAGLEARDHVRAINPTNMQQGIRSHQEEICWDLKANQAMTTAVINKSSRVLPIR